MNENKMNRRTIFILITVVLAASVAAVLSACNFLGMQPVAETTTNSGRL